ncbi:hypothetical protein L0Z72_04320 [candidate division KSB1 bacterium]|nr:hypothetical protein [candidate division KSB1 bacterium]
MRFVMVFTLVLLLISGCGETVQKGAINFSGEWTLNAEKSDMGAPRGGDRPGDREGRRGGMGMGAAKMTVEQKDNELLVETLRQNRDGEEFSIKSTYTLDGKKSKNDSNFGTRVSTAKWSKDGKTLTIESTMTMFRDDQEFTMESTEKWSLDENMLIIETTRSTPMGERTSKAMYDRVEQ